MHEQDIRRAVDRAGNLDSAPAQHTADYLSREPGAGARQAGGAAGRHERRTRRQRQRTTAVEVGADGRAVEVPVPDQPTARLTMDRETFIVIAGGRRDPEPGAVAVEGDEALAGNLLAMMAVTP